MSRVNRRRSVLESLAAAAVMAVASVSAHAQDELMGVEPAHATMYQNGGIGQSEEQFMRNTAKDWPLRMVFSSRKNDEFVADVHLLITDTKGTPYLQLDGAGPMTYARLPPGTYRISARRHGQLETREVTLDGKTGRDVSFHWQGKPKAQ